MNRLCGLVLVILAIFWTGSAHASSDSTCYPEWKLKHTDRSGCSSTALLSPGNDTRVNLLMLLNDRHNAVGRASKYSSDIPERRGDAEPFDWSTFAHKLGPSPAGAEDDEMGNFPFGTRCMSNMVGSAQFIDAVAKAKGLSADERATLTAVRVALNPQCTDAKLAGVTRDALALVKSKAGRGFADYLIGAAAFYEGSFDDAFMAFDRVGKGAPVWPVEAASYMRGRVALQQAMLKAFDEYGGLAEDMTEPGLLDNAYEAFQAYLKSYPAGRYAASASGLLRRVYWLGKDQERLTDTYAALFRQPAALGHSFPDLVQEVDIKLIGDLKPDKVNDPMLLAVLDLRAMRHSGDPKFADYDGPPITRAALAAQRSRFAGNDALFGYVLAAHSFYVENDPADVLRLIPAANIQGGSNYLQYSRQLLRALALDAQGDTGARATLVELVNAAKQPFQRGAAELALALHDERNKGIERVFAAKSPIRDPDLREILLRYHAGPAFLRQRYADKTASMREREVALYTLLYKQVTRGAYADFVRDLALIPANARPKPEDDYTAPLYTDIARFRWGGSTEFVCPSLETVATILSAKPKDAGALLCLGEFIRENGFDPYYYGVTKYLDDQPDKDELGGSPSLFTGQRFSRLEGYKTVIADPRAGAINKSYALYRAVNCFAPSGYNGCDENEVPKNQRRAWFQQLKTDFPASPWTRKLKYYW